MEYSRKGEEDEAGANGGDSTMVLSFLTGMKNAKTFDADLLLVNSGLHDIKTDPTTGKRQVQIDQYRENLKKIISVVREIGSQLVWIRSTPCDETVHNKEGMSFHRFSADCDAYNLEADRIMLSADIPCIDLHTFTKNLGKDLFCDHVHFHNRVREKQGAFIAGWLAGRL